MKGDAPFLTVESKEFEEVVHSLHPGATLPAATTISRRSVSLSKKKFAKFQAILAENSSRLSFGLDIWTSPAQDSYLGITVHYIDDDWVLRECLYDFVPFPGQHTGRHIFDVFEKSIGPLYTKIHALAVDNATNNDTFLDNLILNNDKYPRFTQEHHIRCFAHLTLISLPNACSNIVTRSLILSET